MEKTMKQFLIVAILFYSGLSLAEEKKNDWQSTSLTDELIKKIQQAQLHYKECVITEMQKPDYSEQKSKTATEEIIKHCEPTLAKMREVYIEEKVPEVIADRHLKKMRIQTTRKLLQELMYREAAKAAGQ